MLYSEYQHRTIHMWYQGTMIRFAFFCCELPSSSRKFQTDISHFTREVRKMFDNVIHHYSSYLAGEGTVLTTRMVSATDDETAFRTLFVKRKSPTRTENNRIHRNPLSHKASCFSVSYPNVLQRPDSLVQREMHGYPPKLLNDPNRLSKTHKKADWV